VPPDALAASNPDQLTTIDPEVIGETDSQPSGRMPDNWSGLWKKPADGPSSLDWQRLEKLSRTLALGTPNLNRVSDFGTLVGSEDLRHAPVHRWFAYKEGFSPALLDKAIHSLSLPAGLKVCDSFGGVATTALAGLTHPSVSEVRSVEYSPFARFVGQTKLRWPTFNADRLTSLLEPALEFDQSRSVEVPELAAFSNKEIFSKERVKQLLRAREHLKQLPGALEAERDFLLLGLAAVIEDLSGAMKDGRALRIKRGRTRRLSSLASTPLLVPAKGKVERALAGQWSAMIGDLRSLEPTAKAAEGTVAHHLSGDARDLASISLGNESQAFPDGWADFSLFSPPYLNCIDYTEIYKLELWLMGFVSDQQVFRETRLGTLRSHPSIRFPERTYFDGVEADVVDLVEGAAEWIKNNGSRPEVGPIVKQYFEDMLQVWREQFRVLAPGASAVCVIANSTFSRREQVGDGTRREEWRLPLLTDVIVAELAKIAGFSKVEIWEARALRPRNVRQGQAREALVVVSKAADG
jgi:hypothetical protein